MSVPTIYHVDQHGAFEGASSPARRSPADKDEVWLTPECATTEAPPSVGAGKVAVLHGGQWSIMADHRGQLVYDRATQVARVVVAPGPIADNETLSAPPSPRHQWSVDRWRLPLGDAKADRIAEVGVELMRRNAGGFSYQGYVYQIDDASQARITSLVVLAQANGGADWPVGFRFITTNNIGVPFSAEGFLVFAAASAKVTIARRLCARALKNAIDAATDAATLAAIDITSGWD